MSRAASLEYHLSQVNRTWSLQNIFFVPAFISRTWSLQNTSSIFFVPAFIFRIKYYPAYSFSSGRSSCSCFLSLSLSVASAVAVSAACMPTTVGTNKYNILTVTHFDFDSMLLYDLYSTATSFRCRGGRHHTDAHNSNQS